MADANKFSSPHQEPDEISLFLQQILLRSSSSSSSSSSSFMRQHYSLSDHLHLLPEQQEAEMGGISVPDPFSTCSFTGRAVANVSSSSVGNLDNEPDECDYESELPCLDADDAIMVLSEEAVEALVEATVPKPRSSSKRSRAAEVHNLSEKRRRSRINEKMKALQNLIPNSNKTDKASMLDEAIEYLKQLQLQVQMLTMRNGLSLYPVCLPGMLQPNQISQMRMGICDTDKFVNVNMTKANCTEQNISADVLLKPQENCVKLAPAADFSTAIGLKTSLEEESSIQKQHFGAFQLSKSSKGICQKALPAQSLIEDCPQSSSAGAKAFPSETQKSNLKENILEVRLAGGDHLLPNYANNRIFSSQLNM